LRAHRRDRHHEGLGRAQGRHLPAGVARDLDDLPAGIGRGVGLRLRRRGARRESDQVLGRLRRGGLDREHHAGRDRLRGGRLGRAGFFRGALSRVAGRLDAARRGDPRGGILMNAVIEGKGLKRYYQRGVETVKALDGVDITISAGEMVSILGPSGSGKTTLINLLSCLDAPTGGTLLVGGKPVAGLAEDELVEVRRGVLGFVFQQFHLLPTLTVTENVELPLTFLGRKPDPKRTKEVLVLVGLLERANHLPKELSGGQMQRVAIARALMIEPKILVADEPTGNLDKAAGESIFALFRKLAEQGLAIIITTHNTVFGYQADRVITLEDGRVVKEERPSGVKK